MKYDAAIILGTGIKRDGSLPESCLSNLKTAIKLYKDQKVSKLIFSGKWAWNCIYTPPFTEAIAMKNIAIGQGVPEIDIFTEDSSVTTVSNLCLVKQKILIPNNFKNIIFISANPILTPRNEYNLKMVLGPEYEYSMVMSDFSYPENILQELGAKETQKMKECQNFYLGITPGDDQTILKLAMDDLQKNYITNQL